MSAEPSPHAVLGTLVDRAVCMPYAKPQVLQRGHRCGWDEEHHRWSKTATIQEDVREAATFLGSSLESPSAYRDWSRAQLAVDPAGPWWSKTLDDFLALDDDSQRWVLERLESTAELAAGCLQEESVEQQWTWLWSQPSFAEPGSRRPKITRPDLVAGLDRHRCVIIDLKTTSRTDLSSVVADDQAQAFSTWSASLVAMGFWPVERWVLSVSTQEQRHEWVDFSSSDDREEHG